MMRKEEMIALKEYEINNGADISILDNMPENITPEDKKGILDRIESYGLGNMPVYGGVYDPNTYEVSVIKGTKKELLDKGVDESCIYPMEYRARSRAKTALIMFLKEKLPTIEDLDSDEAKKVAKLAYGFSEEPDMPQKMIEFHKKERAASS